MRVTHLALENYRNYANVDVSLPGGVIALVGDNGQGKTNLIEAVEFLSASSSHRTSDLSQLVRRGFTQGVVRAQLAAGARELVLAIEINNHSPNRAQVNGKVARFRDVAKFLNAVLFSPQDVNLIHGDPENRRRFIDAVVKDIVPSSIKTFADYERTIKHRNALLKSGRANPKVLASLDVWDEKYIQLATTIFEVRVAVLDMIRPLFHRFYESISHTKDPVLIDLDVNRAALSRVTQKPAGPITPDNYAEYVRCYLAECSALERERAH
jgi:DNA replication and repair protein RecF